MTSAPVETLTFFYTDIEGSTRLWQEHPRAMPGVVARHDDRLRQVVESYGGWVFRTMGDAVCAAFHTAPDAIRAAVDGQLALQTTSWDEGIELRVRMAVHTGAAERRDGDYTGHTLNRIARLMAAGHGGQILLTDVTRSLLLDDLPAGVSLRDLGEQQLKDLDRPEQVYQVDAPGLKHSFPPLRTRSRAATNLPPEATSFVGRDAEVDAVMALLHDPHTRLLTLLGPGGTGKTRLALRIGARVLDDYPDGVFFVPLAAIHDPLLVAPAIASALNIRESEESSLEDELANYLRNRDTLLILDNFEQVLAAAPVVSKLLTEAPRLTVLVTSRSVLRLAGEQEFPVPPMAVPDPARLPDTQTLSQYDAVALFIQRARAIKPDFIVTNANAPAVAEVCHRLDGLPLAIELAAARTRLFPPDALLKRLSRSLSVLTGGSRDLPTRQQTLRGAIDWSYSLLSPDQRRLFTRLAVFAGGWTLEAAEEICNVEGDLDVLDGMAALVEQSLVRQDGEEEPRFTMLETIRDYATELLDQSPEVDEICRRHAESFLSQLRDVPELVTDLATMAELLPFFVQEQDNIRAALRRSLEARDWILYANFVRRLVTFWFGQGKWTEGLSWTESVMPLIPADRTAERATMLAASGFFLHRIGEDGTATHRLEEGIDIARELGRTPELSTALYILGEIKAFRGLREEARSLFEQAFEVDRHGENKSSPMILAYLGVLAREEGDYQAARAYMEEGLKGAEALGSLTYAAVVLNALADLARSEGDYGRAASLYERVAGIATGSSIVFTRPGLLHNMAYVLHHQGQDSEARRHFVEALGLYRELGDRRGVAECVAGLGVVDAETDPARGTRLLSAALAAADTLGTRLSSSNQAEYDRALAIIHTHLDEPAFAAAWKEGQATSLDEAVTLAPSGAAVEA